MEIYKEKKILGNEDIKLRKYEAMEILDYENMM